MAAKTDGLASAISTARAPSSRVVPGTRIRVTPAAAALSMRPRSSVSVGARDGPRADPGSKTIVRCPWESANSMRYRAYRSAASPPVLLDAALVLRPEGVLDHTPLREVDRPLADVRGQVAHPLEVLRHRHDLDAVRDQRGVLGRIGQELADEP